MARGLVVVQSHNDIGNIMGRANPILDTKMHQVEFAGSKITELAENIIAKLMYALCNADGNEYLPLDALVDYHKDNKVLSQ